MNIYKRATYFLFIFIIMIGTKFQMNAFKSLRTISLHDLKSTYAEFLNILNPIAKKRVSGTPENLEVNNYITTKMNSYGWIIEKDNFQDQTPYGYRSFSNIIANYPIGLNFKNKASYRSSDFVLKNRIIFACHYDSKFFNDFEFIGATDSAVPCALLLDLAKFLNENFDKKEFSKLQKHLQFIFFDGEEAFWSWSQTDSLYGSRHYVKNLRDNYRQEPFNTIELFVLLDLIGSDSSKFLNYFPDRTGSFYNQLSNLENNLRNQNLLNKKSPYYFIDHASYGRYQPVDDDHVPFLDQNVPILHLIPSPFPKQWHTVQDNLENLNSNTIQDIRIILKYFMLQLLSS